MSMEQIRDAMNTEDGTLRRPLQVARIRGQLRIVIRCTNNSPTCWSMSVILYSNRIDGRIDCIDWEGMFDAVDGTKGTGFHRHLWDPIRKDCEKSKVALPAFNPASVEEFIIQGFKLMGITYESGSGGLAW